MADPTPSGNIPEGLSSKPLGVLKPLGGLGFRLQRYVPLGARPLSVARAKPMRISRSESFLPASTFESPDVSSLIQPTLMDSGPPENSAEVTPESIQRQTDAISPSSEPLNAGDIPPPPPEAIQRQSDRVSPPLAEPLKAGDILPPAPKSTAIQRQSDGTPQPAAEPLKAGDVLPPSPKAAAIQRQTDGTPQPAVEPLNAEDIPPPPPQSIQRRTDGVAQPPAEPLKPGDILPPSPKAAAIQRQTGQIKPAPAPLKAGDILPPSPKAASIQQQSADSSATPEISRQTASEPSESQADLPPATPSASDAEIPTPEGMDTVGQSAAEIQRWSKTGPSGPSPASSSTSPSPTPSEPQVADPDVQKVPQIAADTSVSTPSVSGADESLISRRIEPGSSPNADTNDILSVSNPLLDPPAIQPQRDTGMAASNQPATQTDRNIDAASSSVADPLLQRTSDIASLAGFESPSAPQTHESSSTAPVETAANVPETPSIQRDVLDEVLADPEAAGVSDVTSASSISPAEAVPPSVDLPEVASILEAATPNVQRRESSESDAPGDDPRSAVSPISETTSSIDSQASPTSPESVIQAQDLDNSALGCPLEVDVASEGVAPEVPSSTSLSDESSVQRQATEPIAALDTSTSGEASPTFSSQDASPITPEVTSVGPNVQRQPTTSAIEGTEAVSSAQDSAPVINRSPASALEGLPDAAPIETDVEAASPSSNEGPEILGNVDAIAQPESTTIQRRTDANTEIPATQTSEGVGAASEVQRSSLTEAPPAIETDAEVGLTSSPNTPVLDSEAPTINRVAEPLQTSSAPPSSVTPSIADSPTTVDDAPTINRAVEATDAPTTLAPTDSTPETGATPRAVDVQPASNDTSTISRAAETTDVSTVSTSETEAAPISDIHSSSNDTSTINRAAETIDAPIASPSEVEAVPLVSEIQTGGDISTINRFAEATTETTDLPPAAAPVAGDIPDADIQPGSDDTFTINRVAEAIDAPIAAPPGAASSVADIQPADDTSTINRFAETTPTPPEVTPVADIQAFRDDTSSPAEAIEAPPSAAQPATSPGPGLVQRRVTPDTQDAVPTESQLISTPESLEETTSAEAITADPDSPEISRAPADMPSASQDIDLPKLSTVLKPLSVIQPFRAPNARMTVTNPESLAMLPSEPSEPPKTVPPISPPEASTMASPTVPVIQRQPEETEAAASSSGDSETISDIDISEYPSMPSPDEVMAALAGRSSSQSPTVQRQPESKDASLPDKAAAEKQSISVDKSPQVQRKAMAQPPPTEWSDVESLFNPSQQTGGSPSAASSTSASSESYSNLKPFETIQRRAAQASDTIQREEEAATITPSPNEPVGESASPEALDQLVHQVYALICQRLAVERERYGLSRRR